MCVRTPWGERWPQSAGGGQGIVKLLGASHRWGRWAITGGKWRGDCPREVPMQLEEEKGLSVLGRAPSTKVLEHVNPSFS